MPAGCQAKYGILLDMVGARRSRTVPVEDLTNIPTATSGKVASRVSLPPESLAPRPTNGKTTCFVSRSVGGSVTIDVCPLFAAYRR